MLKSLVAALAGIVFGVHPVTAETNVYDFVCTHKYVSEISVKRIDIRGPAARVLRKNGEGENKGSFYRPKKSLIRPGTQIDMIVYLQGTNIEKGQQILLLNPKVGGYQVLRSSQTTSYTRNGKTFYKAAIHFKWSSRVCIYSLNVCFKRHFDAGFQDLAGDPSVIYPFNQGPVCDYP